VPVVGEIHAYSTKLTSTGRLIFYLRPKELRGDDEALDFASGFVDFGDVGLAVVALEMTEGEERSLHCASAKGADASVPSWLPSRLRVNRASGMTR
jgi:hypothetical protein